MVKKRLIRLVSIAVLILLLMPFALALETRFDITKSAKYASDGFKFIHELFSKPYTIWFTTIVLIILLLYSVFAAAIRKVSIFQGEGAVGLNKLGKMVAVSLAGLSTLSMQYFSGGKGVHGFLINTLSSTGLLGALILAVMFYAITYGNTKSHAKAFVITSIILLIAGLLTGIGGVLALGLLLFIISIIYGIIHFVRSRHGVTAHDVERAERTERRAEGEERHEQRIDQRLTQLEQAMLSQQAAINQVLQQLVHQNQQQQQNIHQGNP